MKKLILLSVIMAAFINLPGMAQSHKYYFGGGIVTASVLGGGKYSLKIDTAEGEKIMTFAYTRKEGDLYVYTMEKLNKDFLTEYQRMISYIKTRTKFSDFCSGKGGEFYIRILGDDGATLTLKGQ